MISNLLLSYFSQSGTNGPEYAEWILSQLLLLYNTFTNEFLNLWNDRENDNKYKEKGMCGELFKGDLYRTETARTSAQVRLLLFFIFICLSKFL